MAHVGQIVHCNGKAWRITRVWRAIRQSARLSGRQRIRGAMWTILDGKTCILEPAATAAGSPVAMPDWALK